MPMANAYIMQNEHTHRTLHTAQGSGVYKYAVDTSASTWGWATSTFPYRLSAQYLYPLVQVRMLLLLLLLGVGAPPALDQWRALQCL